MLDVIFALQEKERLEQGEPIYKKLNKLIKICDEILNDYLTDKNTYHERKKIIKAFIFCNNTINKKRKEKNYIRNCKYFLKKR